MATKQQAELPSPEERDIANYKIGSFLSDLDSIRSTLDHVEGEPKTVEEYLQRQAAGDTLESPQLDRTRLAEIAVFAAEAINDAAAIKEEAQKIHAKALALHREQQPREEIDLYHQRVRDWHVAEVKRGEP